MKKIICKKPNQLVMIEDKFPLSGKGEAIVKLHFVGVCGTDLHAFKGKQPYFSYPRVLGHELAGEIETVDDPTCAFKKGDRVVIIPYLECGLCIACSRGKTNCCTNMQVLGVHRDGGMCEYLTVPVSHLISVQDIPLKNAAIIEPLSIGAHAVKRSEIQEGENVLVIGGGPIGLAVMKYAKLAGAKVIAMDINEEKLTFSQNWAEVDYTVSALQNPLKQLEEITKGDLPTIVFDATGNKNSMSQAFNYVSHGGKLVFVGLIKEEITFNDPDFHKKEMTLLGSRNATREDFEYVISTIMKEIVNIETFISHRIMFKELIDRFESISLPENKVVKAVVEI